MRKLYLLGLAFALVACSGSETAPVESEATVLPAESTEPALSSDPFMSPEQTPASTADAIPAPDTGSELATPVADAAPSAEPPTLDLPPAAGLEVAQPTPPAAPVVPEPSTEPMPEPEAVVQAAPASPTTAPAVVPSPAQNDRNIYQDYAEYQDRVKNRAQAEDELDRRTLFPHEDGAFQLGLDYGQNAFSNYDFDPGPLKKSVDTQGAVLSFNYFPVRSLSYGRLGLGLQGAAYFAKFDFQTAAGPDVSKRHAIDTYGGKLIYELQYFLGQTFVPFAYYGYDKVRVRPFSLASANVNYPATSFTSANYGAGLHLNLNRLEGSAASKALASSGIRKFYLSYTFQQRAEDTGAGHYLGLRFEY